MSMMKNMAIVLGLPISMLGACAVLVPGETADGQVIEENTNKPLAGVIVVGRWIKTYSSGTDTSDDCVHVETAITDGQGRYTLPRHWGTAPYYIDTYKSGYGPSVEQRRTGRNRPNLLAPFTGSKRERLGAIWSSGVQCGSAEKSEKNLTPLYRALYEEAKLLAESEQDKAIVNALLYELDKRELGYEVATRRMVERK